MNAIVGLGNPGSEYEGTRHNVGRLAVQRMAGRWKIEMKKKGCSSLAGEGAWRGRRVGLALPETFMNASGEAVECLAKRWRLGPAAILVVLDDVSLPLGAVRIRGQGTSGGHLGLESVLQVLGTQEVPRLRIGVGPGSGKDLTPFVLGRFTQKEGAALAQGLEEAMEACEIWMEHGVSVAMNRFNRKISADPVLKDRDRRYGGGK